MRLQPNRPWLVTIAVRGAEFFFFFGLIALLGYPHKLLAGLMTLLWFFAPVNPRYRMKSPWLATGAVNGAVFFLFFGVIAFLGYPDKLLAGLMTLLWFFATVTLRHHLKTRQ